MPKSRFTRFSGAVPRYREYSAVERDGILYIVPERQGPACRYDPFEDADGLLLDVTRAGAEVAKEDKDKADAYKKDMEAGLYIDPNLTFQEWSQKWYEGHKDNISATTYESYGFTLKILQTAYLYHLRWPEGFVCPKCGKQDKPFCIKSRHKY